MTTNTTSLVDWPSAMKLTDNKKDKLPVKLPSHYSKVLSSNWTFLAQFNGRTTSTVSYHHRKTDFLQKNTII